MFGRFSYWMGALCVLAACAEPCSAQTANGSPPPKSPPARETTHTLSPLHAFLGIDPVTGEFKSPSASPAKIAPPAVPAPGGQPPARPADGSSDTANVETSPAGTSLRDILSRASESGELPAGDTPIGDTTVDELRTAIAKAVDDRDDQALTAALTKITGGTDLGGLVLPGAKYAQWATLALLIYPLWIALAAVYSAWAGGRRHVRTERDRRHDARQLRRRLALAASTGATIGLLWWAGECNLWLSEPTKLLAALVGLTVLCLTSAALRLVIRRSASDYSRRTIEELRCQHAALCAEVKELRQRLQGEGLAEAV